LFLAAALSWPGIVAVAGFEGPLAGTSAEKPPVLARPDSGASGSSVTAEKPAAASIPVVKPEAARKVEAKVPATQPSPSRAAPPLPKPTAPVVHVVEEVAALTQTLAEDVTNTLGHLLKGVLGG
jgi:hypothetical protein